MHPRISAIRKLVRTVVRTLWRSLTFGLRFVRSLGRWTFRVVGCALLLIILGNVAFSSLRGIPHRALDPDSRECRDGRATGWDILHPVAKKADASTQRDRVANDEFDAIDLVDLQWRLRFSCAIQRHVVPGYSAPDGSVHDLAYDLAFLEFQENGKPYALRELCAPGVTDCTDEGLGPMRVLPRGQLRAIQDHLKGGPHYVIVFIHGWRHDASIGDANVSQLRHYAAHVARFLEDRAALDSSFVKPRVTAIYVGWRGARTDETWLRRKFGKVGELVGTAFAMLTLFDRKPVSEAIAPAVLAGLRTIENSLKLSQPLDPKTLLPTTNLNKMIVFGHSLGGNLLATALRDDLVKKVERHDPGSYMLPVLGDLVVLLNPASEATKWTAVQRETWKRIWLYVGERRPLKDFIDSHRFFRDDQRPIVVSVTAARQWPPGGRRATDCDIISAAEPLLQESKALATRGVDYDWATYDLFPAFKGDLRPLADTMRRFATGEDPQDECDRPLHSWLQAALRLPMLGLSATARTFPFMETNTEETHTIGHLDPPRSPGGHLAHYMASAHPFGTTHELRGYEELDSDIVRKRNVGDGGQSRELPVDYEEVTSSAAACPISDGWLRAARDSKIRQQGSATFWSSRHAGGNAPALQFLHGFDMAGIAAITRANDPFWNVRAFDTALARHDGYMLSSFICAMNQLVMDDITNFRTKESPDASDTVSPPTP